MTTKAHTSADRTGITDDERIKDITVFFLYPVFPSDRITQEQSHDPQSDHRRHR